MLVILLLVVTGSVVSLYYVQYSQFNKKVNSLDDTIASLQQERSALLKLLATNEMGTGAPPSASNSSSINTTAIYDYANASVVTVEGLQPTTSFFGTTYLQVLGSGFVVQYGGAYYIVSNYHVVQNDVNISITFHDGNAYGAKVVGSDPYSDLAVLKAVGTPASEFYPLSLVPSSMLRVGQPVVAIGNPYGLSWSLTEGARQPARENDSG